VTAPSESSAREPDEPAPDDGRVRTLERPEPATAAETIRWGLEAEALVTVFGRCTVEYEGRAASELGAGERHLLLKPDGAALVHTAEGQQPVNWQPPGCVHAVEPREGTLEVRSTRSTPAEELLVSFEETLHVGVFAMSEPDQLSIVGTEADLRERLLEEPSLLEPGFQPLAIERQTPAGAVDVFGEDRAGRTVIVELKRRRAGPDAVSQLRRYVDALERDLHTATDLRGILVAPSVTERAERLLAEHGLEFVALEPPRE